MLWSNSKGLERISCKCRLYAGSASDNPYPNFLQKRLGDKRGKGSQEAREGNLEAGLEEFNELLDATSGLFGNDVLNVIARMNIARIELSNDNFLNALEVLEPLNSSSEHPMVYEVKADALAGLNKNELALVQYNLAIKNIQDESQKSLLKIKINKLTQ